jgi:hypothetical protein
MSGEDFLELFKSASSQWLCDPYSAEIRYIGLKGNEFNKLLSCVVSFWPIGTSPSSSLRVSANQVIAGRELLTDFSIEKLCVLITNLEQGKLMLGDISLKLEAEHGFNYYSEMSSNDRWFCDAHLLIVGDPQDPLSAVEIAKVNSVLRLNEIPFDGLNDLINNLNILDTITSNKQTQIEIRISPPIDIRTDESSITKGEFNLVLRAHQTLNTNDISLAIREFPESLTSRKQVASQLEWAKNENGTQIGKLLIDVKNSFAVQAILMLGKNMVRRQFFDDILKVPNRRLFTLSFFDKELKRLRNALSGTDSIQFEKAINSLAYMLGFSGCVINASDAPDIILSSPDENIVIIECTIKISDFSSKLGKLVDRKNSLIKELSDINDPRKVYSYLVCGLPKNQITINEKELALHKVTLITAELIDDLLNRLKFPQNLEKLLFEDEAAIENYLLQNQPPQKSLI